MVNYQCYRCGWTINHKTKMKNHLTRKRECPSTLSDINLDDYSLYILSGLSFEDFCKKDNIKDIPSKNPQISSKKTITPSKNPQFPSKKTFIPSKNPQISSNDPQFSSKETDNHTNLIEMNKLYDNLIKCNYCNKVFSRNDNLVRHLKTCKEKIKDDEVKNSMTELVSILNRQLETKENQIKDFQMQLDKRDKQIDELIKKAGINNSNNTINIQNNIKLLSYSDTDRSHITDKDILKCLNHSNFCIPHLIEKIHFDINKPENHNVYISNLKNKYVMIYDGQKWKCADRDDQINNLIDDNQSIIEYKLEEWIENGNKYPEMMRKFNRYIEKKDNNVVIDKIKDEIKLLLYNNRNIVKNRAKIEDVN